MQIAHYFERDSYLACQSTGAPDVLLRDAGLSQAIEHSKHAHHIAISAEQGHGEQLLEAFFAPPNELRLAELTERSEATPTGPLRLLVVGLRGFALFQFRANLGIAEPYAPSIPISI